jgi:hypothetical protein
MTKRYFGWLPPTEEQREKNACYTVDLYGWKTPLTVERALTMPDLRTFYDQGATPRCVAFANQWMSSINAYNNHDPAGQTIKYDPAWLFKQAGGTNQGAQIYKALDVLRLQGDVISGTTAVLPAHGIKSYVWARNVDDMRTAIANGQPVSFGSYWHYYWNSPDYNSRGEYWIALGVPPNSWGQPVGGHNYLICAAYDSLDCFGFINTWGPAWPPQAAKPPQPIPAQPVLTRLPYDAVTYLLNREGGEGAIVTDIEIAPPPPPPPPTSQVTAKMDVTLTDGVYSTGVVPLAKR